MRSEVADTIGYVNNNLNSLWTSPRSVLVTEMLLGTSQIVLIFVI